MQRLTKELQLMSGFTIAVAGVETRELDFNLARRSGVVINHIQSQLMQSGTIVATGAENSFAAQEIDLDPDNVDVWIANPFSGDVVEMDTSRLLRHQFGSAAAMAIVGVDGGAGVNTEMNGKLEVDFTNLPLEERPISITNLRHNIRITSVGANAWQGLIVIRYVIVELTLQELGIINAGRR